jgi:hypothetical protein
MTTLRKLKRARKRTMEEAKIIKASTENKEYSFKY